MSDPFDCPLTEAEWGALADGAVSVHEAESGGGTALLALNKLRKYFGLPDYIFQVTR